jgi:hypothetical protein
VPHERPWPGVGQPLGGRPGPCGPRGCPAPRAPRAGERRIDALEEGDQIVDGVTGAALGDHLAGGDAPRREQIGGAVALEVMGHRPSSPGPHRQRLLRTVQRPALGLFVHHPAVRQSRGTATASSVERSPTVISNGHDDHRHPEILTHLLFQRRITRKLLGGQCCGQFITRHVNPLEEAECGRTRKVRVYGT